jgi:hypothetical protein
VIRRTEGAELTGRGVLVFCYATCGRPLDEEEATDQNGT